MRHILYTQCHLVWHEGTAWSERAFECPILATSLPLGASRRYLGKSHVGHRQWISPPCLSNERFHAPLECVTSSRALACCSDDPWQIWSRGCGEVTSGEARDRKPSGPPQLEPAVIQGRRTGDCAPNVSVVGINRLKTTRWLSAFAPASSVSLCQDAIFPAVCVPVAFSWGKFCLFVRKNSSSLHVRSVYRRDWEGYIIIIIIRVCQRSAEAHVCCLSLLSVSRVAACFVTWDRRHHCWL